MKSVVDAKKHEKETFFVNFNYCFTYD